MIPMTGDNEVGIVFDDCQGDGSEYAHSQSDPMDDPPPAAKQPGKQDVDQGGQRDSQKQVLRHCPEILEHSTTSEKSEFINVRNADTSSPADDVPAIACLTVYA